VKQDRFSRARPLWDAVDIGITASELGRIRRMGGNPDRWSYRRRFTCPLCNQNGATETFRGDIYLIDLRRIPRTVTTPMTILCEKCKLELDDTATSLLQYMSFVSENFRTLKGKPVTVQRVAGIMLSKYFSQRTTRWPWTQMTIEQVAWKRSLNWRRTEHDIPGSSAVYRTLAQAAAATPRQHNEVVAAQLYQAAPRRIKLLKNT
jgi:transcription elongation factor Elf1